ncbi:MAG: hypothetical protein MJ066_03170 [Clostridia bacterium]|nr:hypothetical protein [Clostridia bacterium]
MTKNEELNLFLQKSNELIESQYIVADIKIVNLLKTIASSETLLAIFKNCLKDFDFESAKRKYLVKKEYLAEDKGEFILPTSSRELLAFVFNVLLEMDAKSIDIGSFIKKYFFEDGSYSAGYSAFMENMIKPFRSSVKLIMESVIEGKIQDPIEAICEIEERQLREEEERKRIKKMEEDNSLKTYGEALKFLKKMLLEDKIKVKDANIKEESKSDLLLVIDMFASALDSNEKDAISYAFVAYKYTAKAYKKVLKRKMKKVNKYILDVTNGL